MKYCAYMICTDQLKYRWRTIELMISAGVLLATLKLILACGQDLIENAKQNVRVYVFCSGFRISLLNKHKHNIFYKKLGDQ